MQHARCQLPCACVAALVPLLLLLLSLAPSRRCWLCVGPSRSSHTVTSVPKPHLFIQHGLLLLWCLHLWGWGLLRGHTTTNLLAHHVCWLWRWWPTSTRREAPLHCVEVCHSGSQRRSRQAEAKLMLQIR